MTNSELILQQVVSGYLEAALWADRPEGSGARFPKAQEERARADCLEFIKTCGPLFGYAVNLPGYSPVQFGRDFWLNRCGHGVGYWDREALKVDNPFNASFFDRDGKTQAVNRGDELGDALSTIAYGDNRFISKFAYPYLTAYRGWLYFL